MMLRKKTGKIAKYIPVGLLSQPLLVFLLSLYVIQLLTKDSDLARKIFEVLN